MNVGEVSILPNNQESCSGETRRVLDNRGKWVTVSDLLGWQTKEIFIERARLRFLKGPHGYKPAINLDSHQQLDDSCRADTDHCYSRPNTYSYQKVENKCAFDKIVTVEGKEYQLPDNRTAFVS
ncbi:MAG: hypothetical protein MI784_12080, partial [Cytophagales bacterium]|nr:hypothetical protein [Cytophagales bacterium]